MVIHHVRKGKMLDELIKWATEHKMMATFILFSIIFAVGLAFKVGIILALIAIGVIGMCAVAVIAMIEA